MPIIAMWIINCGETCCIKWTIFHYITNFHDESGTNIRSGTDSDAEAHPRLPYLPNDTSRLVASYARSSRALHLLYQMGKWVKIWIIGLPRSSGPVGESISSSALIFVNQLSDWASEEKAECSHPRGVALMGLSLLRRFARWSLRWGLWAGNRYGRGRVDTMLMWSLCEVSWFSDAVAAT